MIRRVYVEKKRGFDVGAIILKKELEEKLGIGGLKSVRIINRYDVDGVSEELFEKAKTGVFAEKPLDEIVEHNGDGSFCVPAGAFVFGVEYLPGQFDQRADSAQLCLRLMEHDEEHSGDGSFCVPAVEAPPVVSCARFFVIEGISGADEAVSEIKDRILKYCINPVDSRQASFGMPEHNGDGSFCVLAAKGQSGRSVPAGFPGAIQTVEIIEGFRLLDDEALRAFGKKLGFAMSDDDLRSVQNYFKDEETRDPTITELRALDTYWSDHCRHTTFNTHLTEISFEEGGLSDLVKEAYDEYLRLRLEVYGDEAGRVPAGNGTKTGAETSSRPVTLMDMATIGAKYLKRKGLLDDLDESEEVNACSIKVKAGIIPAPGSEPVPEDWLVMFKNETHNHPTEIEPLGGASTCLGGGIRDPLSGRAHVHQAMRITGCADPRTPFENTLPGKLPQYQISRTAAKGYSSYGNQIGAATGFVEEIYDESYVAKRMELGALVAAAPAENVVRETPVPGDVILMVGGRTGRDGIGAATGSSKEQSETSIQTAGAEVQKGNPLIERDIVRLFRRREAARLIKRCNDFGAGGIAVAIGELAPGIDVELDNVLTKYEGLDGTELALSESQERMAVVVASENAGEFSRYAAEENLEITQVAKVTDTGRFRMYWRGGIILDLSRKFLDTNGAVQERKVTVLNNNIIVKSPPGALSDLNVSGKRGLIEQFDSTAGAGTLLLPLGGKTQLTPAAGMAAKLPVMSGDTNTATLMSFGYDPGIAKGSVFHSSIYAVLDSCAKICVMGGDVAKIRLSFQEFFPTVGSDPERWASPVMALLGALKAQIALGVPSVGGKDSMSGSYHDLDVVPTLVSVAVCTADAGYVLSPEFKRAGSSLVFLECPRDENGIPDFETFLMCTKRVHILAGEGKILAANTTGQGGLSAAVSKMALGNGIGATLKTDGSFVSQALLNEESYGSLLLEVDGHEDLDSLFGGLPYRIVGETVDSGALEIGSATIPLTEIQERWEAPLAEVFPVKADAETIVDSSKGLQAHNEVPASPQPASMQPEAGILAAPKQPEAGARAAARQPRAVTRAAGAGAAPKPRVFIPVFPGTNGEAEARRVFENAGADVQTKILPTMNRGELHSSIKRLAEEIGRSQVVVIAGGISGGDEPDGSAKLITTVFRNPYMMEAVEDLLENRDGLMLGLGNGFQAFVKLGLLPYGKITEASANSPTIAQNTIGRHMSRIIRVRVCSTLSPWLSAANVGDIHSLPFSTGEGRFVASAETLEALAAAGQIATQYVDLEGKPSGDIRFNPGGSALAVEGLCSPDGRIFGRMGQPERNAPGLYLNVPGCYDDSIFAAGVGYYTD